MADILAQADALIEQGKLIPVEMIVEIAVQGFDTSPYHDHLDGFQVIAVQNRDDF